VKNIEKEKIKLALLFTQVGPHLIEEQEYLYNQA